jgi:hypothetical protein
MNAFDITFDYLISSAEREMRLSQIELDSISILLENTSSLTDMDYFIKSIQNEHDFWSNWKSKSPASITRKTWENPFQEFCSLKPKKSYLTLTELQELVGLHDPKSKPSRRKQLKEWLKSQR